MTLLRLLFRHHRPNTSANDADVDGDVRNAQQLLKSSAALVGRKADHSTASARRIKENIQQRMHEKAVIEAAESALDIVRGSHDTK